MDNGERNRVEGLLGAGLGIFALLLVGYLLWGHAPGLASMATVVPPTPMQASVDIWDAYEQARAVAQVEAEDAQLVSASTQWQTASEEALLAGASNWTFAFYSAANGHVLDVVMSTGEARLVNQTRTWVAPKVMSQGNWQAGPQDALSAFLAYGGREFLKQHPQAVVDLHLAESDDGSTAWTIVALDVSDRGLLSLLIDADTGQVLFAAP